jgi:tRNA(Ile)-lysidine synthase
MMLDKFNTYIKEHKLCRKENHLLLAVSGGLDSMVMADLFVKSGYSTTFLHCNFSLRGDDSDEDAAFVKKAANHYRQEFLVEQFDTIKYAQENSLSIQIAARRLRYEWFFKLLKDKKGGKLATAHHLNDQLETVLFYLSKGSGIKGIAGIPVKKRNIIRPLLFASRAEIAAYAHQNDINWREDISNKDVKYKRNYIRHELIPAMQHLNPSLIHTFGRTAKRLQESREIILGLVEDFKKSYLVRSATDTFLKKEALVGKNTTFIHLLFSEYGLNYQQAEAVCQKIMQEDTGAVFLTPTHKINIDRDHVIISKSDVAPASLEIMPETIGLFDEFDISILKKEEMVLVADKNVAFLDYNKLHFPLRVRKWREGDRFIPLGMKGQKKLSDFMIDSKIALNLKDRQLVLESRDEIVWVIGQRIDERYKVTDNSKVVYRIKWINEKPV